MLEDMHGECETVCEKEYSFENSRDVKKVHQLRAAIRKDYMMHFIMDNLPAVECTGNCRGGARAADQPVYRLGFPIGCDIGEASKSMTICTVPNILHMTVCGAVLCCGWLLLG